uniref:Uncharacterized protein n=1 Tax=Acanthochromis polyacanthus TaxID=80966 RepID=A0A3Q1G9N5_9TELE
MVLVLLDLTAAFDTVDIRSSSYKTVSGVNGPLVILDQVKVRLKIIQILFIYLSAA